MDKTIDFGQLKTYQLFLLNDENNIVPLLNELNKKRLENAITGNMGKKGMSLSQDPDIKLAYGVNLDSKKTMATYGSSFGGFGTVTSEEYNNYSGIITLAILEKETDKLLWYASSEKEIEGEPKNYERNINKIVAEIFEAFPIDHFQDQKK